MDGVRHRQSYGNVLAAASSAARSTHPHHPHLHSQSARGGDTSQQQSSSRHQSVIAPSQRPHPLQHSASTVTGGGPGVRRESRETRRSISIPVIGDNRTGGKYHDILILLKVCL